MSRRERRFGGLHPWFMAALIVAVAASAPVVGQEHTRVNGTVQSIVDRSLTLRADTPIVLGPPLLGLPVAPGSTPRPHAGLYVDLRQLSPAEYASIRPGDRITVAGVISDDGLIATFISLRPGPQSP